MAEKKKAVKKTKPTPAAAVIDFAKLAKAVGKDARQLRIWARRKDAPRTGDAAAWKNWIQRAIRERQPKKKRGHMEQVPAAAPAKVGTKGTAADVRPAGEVNAESTPLEIARLAVQVCWRNVKHAIDKNILGVDDVDALKKSLQELRQGELDQIELDKLRGNLIDRGAVKELCGNLASRLVRCVGVLEHSIGTEFAVWMADPAMQAMRADDRARKVREFVKKTCDDVLRIEADAVIKELLASEQET